MVYQGLTRLFATQFLIFAMLGSGVALADGTSTATTTNAINDYINAVSGSTGTSTDSGSVLVDQALLGGAATNTNTSTSTTMSYASTTVSVTGTNTSTGITSSNLNLGNISSGVSTNSGLNQQSAQQTYQKSSGNASQDASMISIAAIAVGTVMVMNQIQAGYVLIAAGIAGEGVAMIMGNNANSAGGNAGNLSSISGIPGVNSTTPILPSNNGPSASNITGNTPTIDPSLLTSGQLGTVLSDFTAKSGITAAELANAVQTGASIPDLLASAPSGLGSTTADALKDGIANATADGASLSRDEILAKTGLSANDLHLGADALLAGNTAVGGSRSPAGKNSNFKNSFDTATEGKASEISAKNSTKISSELQAAIDKNGLSNRSIFEIVHIQYLKQMPMMRGIQKKEEKFDNPLEAKVVAPSKGM